MITGADAWHDLPGHGQHILRCLYQLLAESRKFHGDQLAVILSGQAGPLRAMLHASPALAARFPVIIGFPGYTPAQLTAILQTLAAEAGRTPAAARKAAAVLADAENGPRHRQRPPRRPAAHPGHHQPGPAHHHQLSALRPGRYLRGRHPRTPALP
jgi:hypothetical protein